MNVFSSMDWNDSDWVTVDLPHTWNAGDVIDEQRDIGVAYLGIGRSCSFLQRHGIRK